LAADLAPAQHPIDPQEFQAIVAQQQIVQYTTSPHYTIDLLSVFIPSLSILINKLNDMSANLRIDGVWVAHIRYGVSQNHEPALQNTKGALNVLSNGFHLEGPKRRPLI
jgi:hypothetical protein